MISINGYEITGRMPVFKARLRELVRLGIKTETRRIMKKQPPDSFEFSEQDTATHYTWTGYSKLYECSANWTVRCPYGRPGDIRVLCEPLTLSLETFINHDGVERIYYESDWTPVNTGDVWKWQREGLSALFMPTRYGRILTRYTEIRAERLHDIDDAGALAEGVQLTGITNYEGKARDEFIRLWDEINKDHGYSWSSNPWVWVVKWELLDV